MKIQISPEINSLSLSSSSSSSLMMMLLLRNLDNFLIVYFCFSFQDLPIWWIHWKIFHQESDSMMIFTPLTGCEISHVTACDIATLSKRNQKVFGKKSKVPMTPGLDGCVFCLLVLLLVGSFLSSNHLVPSVLLKPYVCMYVCMHACVCVCVCVYIYIYTHTHTHTHQ